MNLAAVVSEARDLEPIAFGIDHAPPGEIVDRSTPQHRFLAARIHRDIAADAGGIRRSRIDREHQACLFRCIRDASCDDACLGVDRRHLVAVTGQIAHFDRIEPLELFGIDDRGHGRERNGAARVTRAAATRNDRKAKLDAGTHERGNLRFRVGADHHEWIFDTPVGGIRDVRDARECIEADAVLTRMTFEQSARTLAQHDHALEFAGEGFDGLARQLQQLTHFAIAFVVSRHPTRLERYHASLAVAAPLDLVQAMMQRLDEQASTLRVIDEVVLKIGITLHDPDIAEHLVQHARRASRTTFLTQFVQQLPGAVAEQANDDFAIRERGVVVRNLAQPRGCLGDGRASRLDRIER